MSVGTYIMNKLGFKSDDCGSGVCDVEIQDGKIIGGSYGDFGSAKTTLSRTELGLAYEKISCIGTGIDLIANNMQMIEPVFWDNDKREAVEYPTDKNIKSLRRLLEKPSATTNRKTFIAQSVKSYVSFGVVYYAFYLGTDKQIISIEIIDDVNITPFEDMRNSKIDNYTVMNSGTFDGKYISSGSYYQHEQNANIILAPFINSSPQIKYRPASFLQGCGIEALMYWFGCYHNKSLLTNGARPSLAILIKSMLNPKHREKLREEIRVRHSGSNNAGSAIILDGAADKDIKQLSQNNKDMEFNAALESAKAAIQERLGTNWVLGKNINSRDLQKGMEIFFDMTVCPMFQGIFNHVFDVYKYFNPKHNNLSIFYLEQDVPALRPRFLAMMKDLPNLGIFTIAERRKLYNYPPLGDDRDNDLAIQTVKVTQTGASGTNDTEFTAN